MEKNLHQSSITKHIHQFSQFTIFASRLCCVFTFAYSSKRNQPKFIYCQIIVVKLFKLRAMIFIFFHSFSLELFINFHPNTEVWNERKNSGTDFRICITGLHFANHKLETFMEFQFVFLRIMISFGTFASFVSNYYYVQCSHSEWYVCAWICVCYGKSKMKTWKTA